MRVDANEDFQASLDKHIPAFTTELQERKERLLKRGAHPQS